MAKDREALESKIAGLAILKTAALKSQDEWKAKKEKAIADHAKYSAKIAKAEQAWESAKAVKEAADLAEREEVRDRLTSRLEDQ